MGANIGVLLFEFHEQAEERVRKGVATAWMTWILGFFVVRQIIGFENIFGQIGSFSYVRYFEYIAAPGLLFCALNLRPFRRLLEWRPLLWLGALSGAIYYVHNNIMEDYRILNSVLKTNINFSSGVVFLLVLISIIPFAYLWNFAGKKWKEKTAVRR